MSGQASLRLRSGQASEKSPTLLSVSASRTLTNRIAVRGGGRMQATSTAVDSPRAQQFQSLPGARIMRQRYAFFAPPPPQPSAARQKTRLHPRKTARNSFWLKILPVSSCSSKIFPAFSP